jgi:hypothetical protein
MRHDGTLSIRIFMLVMVQPKNPSFMPFKHKYYGQEFRIFGLEVRQSDQSQDLFPEKYTFSHNKSSCFQNCINGGVLESFQLINALNGHLRLWPTFESGQGRDFPICGMMVLYRSEFLC